MPAHPTRLTVLYRDYLAQGRRLRERVVPFVGSVFLIFVTTFSLLWVMIDLLLHFSASDTRALLRETTRER